MAGETPLREQVFVGTAKSGECPAHAEVSASN
jgi:hypothetical protein